MNKATFRSNKFPALKLIGLFLICMAIFLSQRFYVNDVLSQNVEQTTKDTEKQMEKEEKIWVEILRSKEARSLHPGKVLEAIDELGKVAQLRGISSTDAMSVLADYLDVHRDSLIQSRKEPSKPPEIIFQPHPILPEDLYPAVVTFQRIGKTALPILVRVIENSDGETVKSNNAIFLIKYNFREDWNKAADYLREGAKLAKSEKSKQRLLAAASKIR